MRCGGGCGPGFGSVDREDPRALEASLESIDALDRDGRGSIIDDYAHHPTETRLLWRLKPGDHRVVGLFQLTAIPHELRF
jgi:hypothetical protein